MSLETDLRTYLVAQAPLTALVGARIYGGGKLPHSPTYPNIVWAVIDHEPHTTISDAGTIDRRRLQFDVRAEDYAGLLDVCDQLVAAMNSATRQANGFISIYLETTDFPYEPVVETFRRIVDYAVWSRP